MKCIYLVVRHPTSKVHDGKFGQIVVTTEKPGTAKYTLPRYLNFNKI